MRFSAATLLSTFLIGSLAEARVTISEEYMPAELVRLTTVNEVSEHLVSASALHRLYAAMRLGQIGGPEAVQVLVAQYGREYGHMLSERRTTGAGAISVMAYAFQALARIGSVEAREALQAIGADIRRRCQSGTIEARAASMAAPSLARAVASMGDEETAERVLQEIGNVIPEDVKGEIEAKMTEATLRRRAFSEQEMIQQAFLSVGAFKPSKIPSAELQQRVCHLAGIILTFGSPTRTELRQFLEQLPEKPTVSQYLCSCSIMRSFFVEAERGAEVQLTDGDKDVIDWIASFWASLHDGGYLSGGPYPASDLLTHYLVEFRDRFADEQLKRLLDQKLAGLIGGRGEEETGGGNLGAPKQAPPVGPAVAQSLRRPVPANMSPCAASSLGNSPVAPISRLEGQAPDDTGEKPHSHPRRAKTRQAGLRTWAVAALLVLGAFAVSFSPLLVFRKRSGGAVALATVAALVLTLVVLVLFSPTFSSAATTGSAASEYPIAESLATMPPSEPLRDPQMVEARLPVAGRPIEKSASGLIAERIALLGADPLGKEGQVVAKALGDLTLDKDAHEAAPEDLRERVDKAVDVILQETAAKTGQERMAAKHQLERLWRLSADRLIENLDNPNMTIAEAAAKTLILMRNEHIVRAIIAKVGSAGDERARFFGVFALGKMTEQRETIVKNRECMSPEESARLARELIIPFLEDLANAEQSERVKPAIERALRELREDVGPGQ